MIVMNLLILLSCLNQYGFLFKNFFFTNLKFLSPKVQKHKKEAEIKIKRFCLLSRNQ